VLPALSFLETRVLGVLVEKERTVPDTYPLSLNALTLGCNQKNNRHPVSQATEAEVQAAVDALRPLALVIESSGSRVMRYAHNLGRVLHVSESGVALLAALMLRGPQTPGELRVATERLHRFADPDAVEAALRGLAERGAGPLVAQLRRVAGARESRWAHLLSGPADAADFEGPTAGTSASPPVAPPMAAELASLRADVTRLQRESAELRAIVERLARDFSAAR
jgi:uncharacterized protein YceH (UPF0502 family)